MFKNTNTFFCILAKDSSFLHSRMRTKGRGWVPAKPRHSTCAERRGGGKMASLSDVKSKLL